MCGLLGCLCFGGGDWLMIYGDPSYHGTLSWLTAGVFPKWMAFTNVLVIFAVLKGLTLLMPVSVFRIAFTNGLMSESMVVWFTAMLARERRKRRGK